MMNTETKATLLMMKARDEKIDELKAENARLRKILVDVCNATMGACTHDVSVDFLAHLPGEVTAMTAKLQEARQEIEHWKVVYKSLVKGYE